MNPIKRYQVNKLLFAFLILSTLFIENFHEAFRETSYCVTKWMPNHTSECEKIENYHETHADFLPDCIDIQWAVKDLGIILIICILLFLLYRHVDTKSKKWVVLVFLIAWITEIGDYILDFNQIAGIGIVAFVGLLSAFFLFRYE